MIATRSAQAQTLAVKRAQVAFHSFAAMGELDKALAKYESDNARRRAVLEANLDFVGTMTPFLEVGANVGHTSYLFANEFGADGVALDVSADALRLGQSLPSLWNWNRRPLLVTGDAVRLPARDNSFQFVATFQTLSQFQDIDVVVSEVARVLRPGGVFFMAEEPILRRLTLRLRRVPYVEQMKPWEVFLHRHGLLDFIARDVIGAEQEESFGIRQNHRLGLASWRKLLSRHFSEIRFITFARENGWANECVARAIRHVASEPSVASLLGGTLAAFCRKPRLPTGAPPSSPLECLACPNCGAALAESMENRLTCVACAFMALPKSGVFNLLPDELREELFPSQWRPDILDFSKPEHAVGLIEGFYALEGDRGANYRWIGKRAVAILKRVQPGPSILRIRGYAHPGQFDHGKPAVHVIVNGAPIREFKLKRHGLFVLETEIPDAPEYVVEIHASPVWRPEGEDRDMTLTLSKIRLLPSE